MKYSNILFAFSLIITVTSACKTGSSDTILQELNKENKSLSKAVDSLSKRNEELNKEACIYKIKLASAQGEWQKALDLIASCRSDEVINWKEEKKLRKLINSSASNYKNKVINEGYLNLLDKWIPVYDTNIVQVDTFLIDQYSTKDHRFSYNHLPFAKVRNFRFEDQLRFKNINFIKNKTYLLGSRKIRDGQNLLFLLFYVNPENYRCHMLVLAQNQAILDHIKILDKYSEIIAPEPFDQTDIFLNGIEFTSDSTFTLKALTITYNSETVNPDTSSLDYIITRKGQIEQLQ